MLELTRINQQFARPRVDDLDEAVAGGLADIDLEFPAGAPVAVGVGSRGIAGLQRVVAAVVAQLRRLGASPFIVPAMGSHGGATAEGQREVLASYGITEDAVGAPVRCTMDVVELPRGDAPCRVFMDSFAAEAYGTVVINRAKVHTDFHGPHESGIVKMLVIGLGKQRQAMEVHQYGVRGLRDFVPEVAGQVLRAANVLFGVGLVENAYHEVADLRIVPPARFHAEDASMLELSRTLMPMLPADRIDVLLVDELGKDVSGTGLDTNVIGRLRIAGEQEPESPRIGAIAVCDVTEASHGNAIGVGLCDVITRRLFDKIDFRALAENVVTSSFLERGKVPVVAATDLEAFEWALRTCGPLEAASPRVMRIRNTLELGELAVSAAVLEELSGVARVRRAGRAEAAFDERGALRPL